MFRNPPGYCTTLEDFAASGSFTLNGCPGRGEPGRESAVSPPLNAKRSASTSQRGVSVLSAGLPGPFKDFSRRDRWSGGGVGVFGLMSHRADTGQFKFGEGGVPLERWQTRNFDTCLSMLDRPKDVGGFCFYFFPKYAVAPVICISCESQLY